MAYDHNNIFSLPFREKFVASHFKEFPFSSKTSELRVHYLVCLYELTIPKNIRKKVFTSGIVGH